MKSFFRFVLLALVLLLVALVSALTAMRFAIHGREVAVPDFTGKSPIEARRISETHGLVLEVERQYYSPTIREGRILSQVPAVGTLVRRGWQVRVAESLGPQRVDIPNVIGQSERAAEINIRRRGLDVGSVASVPMPGVPAGQVLSQNPPPNSSTVTSPKLSLLVSDTPPLQQSVMPNFVGQALGSVTTALQDAGIKLGTVTVAAQPPVAGASSQSSAAAIPLPTSIVVAQNPAPGQKVVSGSTVTFQVRP